MPTIRVLLPLAALVLAAGCDKGTRDAPADDPSAGAGPSGELMVFAAASLTDAFNEVGEAFEEAHPDVDVIMSFAGSQSLRTQIENGAQPQVFASANADHMDTLREKQLVGEPVVFVNNALVVVVPRENPAGIGSLADLAKAERIVLASENVPAGAYSKQVLESASSEYGADFADRVRRKVVSHEHHVRQTLQKVVLGEADAAIVYATDAAAVGDEVELIDIPDAHNVIAEYPIATVTGAPRAELGALFIEFVQSDTGKAVLEKHGFRTP